MFTPLAITGLGMTSCLADDAPGNAAMMRCRYSGFETTGFDDPDQPGNYLVGAASMPEPHLRGLDHYLRLLQEVVTEAVGEEPPTTPLPLILCLQEMARPNGLMSCNLAQDLYDQFMARYQDTPCRLYRYVAHGRVGLVHGLREAAQLLASDKASQVLLVCIDSLLHTRAIQYYLGNAQTGRRLQGVDFSNGFIPGEAAVALRLGVPDGSAQTVISGTGLADEPAPLHSGDVLRAEGLCQAIRAAAAEAQTRVCDTDFRLSSANGEEYWFREASLAQTRALEAVRPSQPLWHPADHIGEVGAAVGGAIVVMAHYAFAKGYALGPRALAQLSNDDAQRAAFILERVSPA